MVYQSVVISCLLVLLSGCSLFPTTGTKEDENIDMVNTDAVGSQEPLVTAYQFVFPGTGWYMDFNYSKGFEVKEDGNVLKFFVNSGDQVNFVWKQHLDNEAVLQSGEDFRGKGWWGKKYISDDGVTFVEFLTPDNKYFVTVSGTGDVFDTFVEGMVMGK